jgi:hypothetical protein
VADAADIVFNKRDKMYVVNLLEWIRGDEDTSDCYNAGDIDLVLMTVQEREKVSIPRKK